MLVRLACGLGSLGYSSSNKRSEGDEGRGGGDKMIDIFGRWGKGGGGSDHQTYGH